MDGEGLLVPTGVDAAWGVFALAGLVMVAIVAVAVVRGVRMAQRGQNPLTLPEDLAYRVERSAALAPQRTKGERLDELDALRRSGRITAEEHAAARERILAE